MRNFIANLSKFSVSVCSYMWRNKTIRFLMILMGFLSINYAKQCYVNYRLSFSNTYSLARVSKVLYDDNTCYYKFHYLDNTIETVIAIPPLKYRVKEGDRYLVKIVKNELWISEIKWDYLMPNCIYRAPYNGWEGVPDSSKICEQDIFY